MIKTGLIVKIEDEYAIVMTKDHSYQRILRKDNMNIGSEIMYTDSDVMTDYRKKRVYYMKKKLLLSVPVFAVILMVAIFSTRGNDVITVDETTVASATIVTVDINPSFRLYADESNYVIQVRAMNADAETIDTSDLKGQTVANALEMIVRRAETAGFIDTDDLEDDFVLVTTIDADPSDDIDNGDVLKLQIQEKAQDSDCLEKVNVALATANMEQLKNAEQNQTLAGLAAMNMGEQTSVKEFFANKENAEQFMQNGNMIEESFEHQLQVMQKVMEDAEFDGELKNQLAMEFEYCQNAYLEVSNQYQQAMSNYNNASESESQALLQKAEEIKLQLEANEQNVVQVREIMKSAVNNSASEQQLMEQLSVMQQQRESQQSNQQNEMNDDKGNDSSTQGTGESQQSEQGNSSNASSTGQGKK